MLNMFRLTLLMLAVQLGNLSYANNGQDLQIHTVLVDFELRQLSVKGLNLLPKGMPGDALEPIVQINEMAPFVIVFASPEEVVVDVPNLDLLEGDYLLSVSTGIGESQRDTWNLTLGAVGPQGLPGRDGVDSKAGRDGIDGKAGKDGVDGKVGDPGPQGPPGPPGSDGANGRDATLDFNCANNETLIWSETLAKWVCQLPQPFDIVDQVDCSADPKALNSTLESSKLGRRVRLSLVGHCKLDYFVWGATGTYLELRGEQGSNAVVEGELFAVGAVALSVSDLSWISKNSHSLRLFGSSNLVLQRAQIDSISLGASSAYLNDVNVKRGLVLNYGSAILGAGQIALRPEITESEGQGSAFILGSGSSYTQSSGSLLIGGSVDLQQRSSLNLGGLTSLVFEDTIYIGSSALESYAQNTVLRKGTDDLGRGLSVGNSSSAHFWGSVTMEGFESGDQAVRIDFSSTLMIRGREGIRSTLGNVGLEGGSSAFIRDAVVESVAAQGSLDLQGVTINQPSWIQRGGSANFGDLTFGPNGGMHIDSGSVTLNGSVMPALSSFSCSGPAKLDAAGVQLSQDSGTNCLDGSGWSRLLESVFAP